MSFLIQRPTGRGYALTQVSAPVLRIGRGTNQELRSDNPAVALEHAIVELDAAGYLVTDKGSITGTYVNRRPVETARLAKGDVIEIGDLRIEVQLADPAKPLFLRVITARAAAVSFDDDEEDEVVAAAAAPGQRVVKPKKIDYVGAYRLRRPYLTKLSITAILLIVALAVVGEIIRPEKQTLFMPGGVSSAHARAKDATGNPVATNCDACHTPFKSVSNQKCIDCHQQQPHADLEKDPPACFDCHAEHRGAAKLAAIDNRRCTDCHADLGPHMKVPRASFIAAFDDRHPDFVYPKDVSTLRFNHKLHLAPRGVFNDKGQREVLQCAACHGAPEPVAIEYEKNCQRCHRLTFDARYPNAEVPHGGGDTGIVYGFIASYAGDPSIATKSPTEVRRLLAARRTVVGDTRATSNAEQVIKTKCRKCHEIVPRGARLNVTPPVMLTEWLAGARFTHGRHRMIACEDCHEGARASAATSDLLMPRRGDCSSCHAPDTKVARAGSACLTCHEYHLRPQKAVVTASLAQAGGGGLGGVRRMLQSVLLAVIVVLLVVVLVPVGIALFQRIRPERTPRTPSMPPKAPPPARVPPPIDNLPTAKIVPPPEIARLSATPPQPPPQQQPQSTVEATRIEKLPDIPKPAGGHQGTEMVQWFGMLHCTSGALEGQRFVVEEDGFYIGRDPVLSKIVIPDSRVSKRHVRILVRDGRVWAVDEGSTNGTFLAGSGQRITEVQLKRGDTLVLGDNAATFVYQI